MTFLSRYPPSRHYSKILLLCIGAVFGYIYSISLLHVQVDGKAIVLRSIERTTVIAEKPTSTQYPYTIVTAASANHLCALESFLYTLNDLRPELSPQEFPRIVVYNLGINRTQLQVLDQFVDSGLVDELHHFNYASYPRFWDVSREAGQYAWKTGIINEVRQRTEGLVLWLDSGNVASAEFLKSVPDLIRSHDGFWSPRSESNLRRWTHPLMFSYFGLSRAEYGRYANCNGAVIGFDTSDQKVVDEIIVPWYRCALEKACIAPRGSSRDNHRQDQAALSLLVYQHGLSCRSSPREFNLQVHRDDTCRVNLMEREILGKLAHPSALDLPVWEHPLDTKRLYDHPDWRYPADEVPTFVTDTLAAAASLQ